MKFYRIFLLAASVLLIYCNSVEAFIFKPFQQKYYKQPAKAQPAQSTLPVHSTRPSQSQVDAVEEEWICLTLINEERQRRRLPPLEYCPVLASASRNWSAMMTQIGFKHGSGNEVIARGGHTASFAHRIWMNSPPHRAALTNPNYKQVGFGMVNGYWTARFK